jgi:hypothetical protein
MAVAGNLLDGQLYVSEQPTMIGRIIFTYIIVQFMNSAVASPGVSHGTYFATYFANDYIAVAIDSRRTEDRQSGEHLHFDDQCKIVLLSDRAVFIAEGIISNTDARAPRFDGFQSALNSYAKAEPRGSLSNAAARWADELKTPLEQLYPFYRQLFDRRHDGEIVVGYFFGIDHRENLSALAVKIIHRAGDPAFNTEILPLQEGAYTLGGPGPLAQELLLGNTERARKVQVQIIQEATGKTPPEAMSTTLKYLVANIPRWANDPDSGGEVAQLIVDGATKQWRWINRPSFCE